MQFKVHGYLFYLFIYLFRLATVRRRSIPMLFDFEDFKQRQRYRFGPHFVLYALFVVWNAEIVNIKKPEPNKSWTNKVCYKKYANKLKRKADILTSHVRVFRPGQHENEREWVRNIWNGWFDIVFPPPAETLRSPDDVDFRDNDDNSTSDGKTKTAVSGYVV